MGAGEAGIRTYGAALAFVMTCVLAPSANAKTLYVNSAMGNDTTTYTNNDASQPWATIGRAAWGSMSYDSPNGSEAAQAGDTVLIAAGIYWESGDTAGGRFTVSLNPANSGTFGNPITFRGVGDVYIRLNGPGTSYPAYRGALVGCSSRNYIVWDHFILDDFYSGSTADTGPVVFFTSQHCQLVNSEVIGHRGTYYHGYPTFEANYRGISLEPAYFTTIRNNRVHDLLGTAGGILAYDSDDNIIEHNEVYNVEEGIYLKGIHVGRTQARNVIRYNLVHDCRRGIQTESAQDTLIYQNIVKNSSDVGLYAGAFGPTRSKFINNTVYGSGSGSGSAWLIATIMVDVEFRNNIFSNSSAAYTSWNVDNPGLQSWSTDRNLYYNQTRHADYTGGPVSFSSMQRSYGRDANSINGSNPLFVNAASGNFQLESGSPALTLGLDVLDLNRNGSTVDTIPAGAYITGTEVIGPSPQSSITPPIAPTNLRFQ